MTHVLDRPVWNALNGPHAALAEGGALARRYRPDVIPFAAARTTAPRALPHSPPCPRPARRWCSPRRGPSPCRKASP